MQGEGQITKEGQTVTGTWHDGQFREENYLNNKDTSKIND